MLYHLSLFLKHHWSLFNVIHYVSFRAIAALLSTLFFSFFWGNWFIDKSKMLFRSQVREHTPERHKEKNNSPTMGGLFIVGIVVLNALLWCDLSKPHPWISILCLLGFGGIGAWDDWSKICTKQGIAASTKSMLQILVAMLVVISWLYTTHAEMSVSLPFFKNVAIPLGYLFVAWSVFIIVACSNAVNLTDGLDGLAIGSLMPNFATFALISYLAGHAKLAAYLHIPFAATAEMAIVGSILVGASLGFLWYNTYPAQIFMGDVGALSLGAILALMALMAKQIFLL